MAANRKNSTFETQNRSNEDKYLTKSLVCYGFLLFRSTIDNKDQFGNIRNVVLGPSPFKNVDLRVKILKNDEVEMLNRP